MFSKILTVLAIAALAHCGIIKVTENKDNFVIKTDSGSSGKDWWQTATLYQIYPRSFKDSNNDGKGDIRGIIDKLDYIKSLGVDAIWLSPIFKSPQVDQGYDISDFRDIDPDYGTLGDFLKLIEAAHNSSIKIILDFVPNHSSDQHEWFKKSANRTVGYEDYYIWADARTLKNGTKAPPNNWLSVFKYSAWTWNEERQQYYFHQFLKEQPDLNFRNEKVMQEMKDILTFWLDTHDVDGVRIDAVPHLVEAKNLTNEPLSNGPGYTEIDYEYLDHIYTTNQPESFDVIYSWRNHLDNITKSKNVSSRIFMTEAATSIENVVKYYGADNGTNGAHFSFNFFFLGLTKNSTAEFIKSQIETWFSTLPSRFTFNWLLGNHDNHRIASKTRVEEIDGLNMLTAFLPGIQITYNGEEIGMEDGNVTCAEGQDGSAIKDNCTHYESSSRDFERTPFQWDNTTNAGFNSGFKTWLPVSSKYKECNAADQQTKVKSHLNIYKNLQKLRADLVNKDKTEVQLLGKETSVLEITRYVDGSKSPSNIYDYIFNVGTKSVTGLSLDTRNVSSWKVIVASANSLRNIGDVIKPANFTIEPYETLILNAVAIGGQSALTSSYLYLGISALLYFICNV